MNKDVEDMIALGKDSIIQLALKILDKDVDVRSFSKINVMTDGREVYVSFMNPIKYLPINSAYYFDASVMLFDRAIVRSPVSNGTWDSEKEIPFFIQTNESKRHIRFVIEAINNSDEIGSLDPLDFEGELIIREQQENYSISIVSKFQESSYTLEKITGKIKDASHVHFVPAPIESENAVDFLEIR